MSFEWIFFFQCFDRIKLFYFLLLDDRVIRNNVCRRRRFRSKWRLALSREYATLSFAQPPLFLARLLVSFLAPPLAVQWELTSLLLVFPRQGKVHDFSPGLFSFSSAIFPKTIPIFCFQNNSYFLGSWIPLFWLICFPSFLFFTSPPPPRSMNRTVAGSAGCPIFAFGGGCDPRRCLVLNRRRRRRSPDSRFSRRLRHAPDACLCIPI